MANTDIVTRAGAGAALTSGDHDQNMKSLAGIVEEITGNLTVDYQDQGKTIQCNLGSAIVVTLGTAASIIAAGDTTTFQITFKNINSGLVTVIRSSTDTIDGATSVALNGGDSVTLQTNAAGDSWKVIARDMDVVDINGGTIDGTALGTTNTGNTETAGNDSTKLATTAFVQDTKWELLGTLSSTGNIILGAITTGIPTTAVGIKFVCSGIASAAAASHHIVLGDSGGYSTSVEGSSQTSVTEVYFDTESTFRFALTGTNDAYGTVEFQKLDGSDVWVGHGIVSPSTSGWPTMSAGQITLAGDLDRCKVELQTSTYSGGSVQVYVRS